MKKYILIILFLVVSSSFSSLFAGQIYAYPVPFNHKKGNTTIKIGASPAIINASRIDLKIYDINGDLVFSRVFVGVSDISNIQWNVRNSRGQRVKPGLYIIRIEVEADAGVYFKQNIRILVAG